MKHYMTISAIVLTGTMLMAACGNENNENPTP